MYILICLHLHDRDVYEETTMNVMRLENANLAKSRGNGRGRRSEHILNILPKYRKSLKDPISTQSAQDLDTNVQKHLRKLYSIPMSGAKTPLQILTESSRNQNTSSALLVGTNANKWSTESNKPGTKATKSSSNTAASRMILAVTSGRGEARSEVGLAAIDLRYPYIVLCQISDCQAYVNTLTKIFIFDPIEILMPDTMCNRNSNSNNLYTSIREKFPNLRITPVSRMHFKETEGLERIKAHTAIEYSSVELFVKQKYYALSAVAALMKYIEFIEHIVYAPKSMKVEFQGSPNTTMIDIESAQNLELVTSQSGQSSGSLLGVMDHCLTSMGRRLLRSCILQPSCDKNQIMQRQSCVTELVLNRSLSSAIQSIVRRLFGVDCLLKLPLQTLQSDTVQSATHNLNYVLLLKNCLDIIPELREILNNTDTAFFKKVRNNLENQQFEQMKDEILKIIHPDAKSVMGYTSSNMQRCFAINVGINDLLDIARQTFCELIDDMKSLVEQLAHKHKLPVTLECNTMFGYHIAIDIHQRSHLKIEKLPADFIEIRKNRNSLSLTTNALMVLNQQCKVACDELHIMSNVLLCDLLRNIRQHIGCLFQLHTDIAELDLILSLAHISSIHEYVKPSFSTKLELRNSMHPIMATFGTESMVPNDIEASIAHNFHTIIGPNMSGKSVYLKQIVLLHIMAQIGCYVPAVKAEFRIVDRIFCRICHRDDIEFNASMFMLEMKEIQYTLQSITPKSLVILDELCRATTVEEGSSIAWAICEQLLMTRAFTFCATHFLHLTKLVDLYHNATNHCFEAVTKLPKSSKDPRLIYTHKLVTGTGLVEDYGVKLAELCGIPESIIKKARDYALEKAANTKLSSTCSLEQIPWEKKCYDYVAKMYILLENNEFTYKSILSLINDLHIGCAPKTTVTEIKSQKHLDTVQVNSQVTNTTTKLNTDKSNTISMLLSNVTKRTATDDMPDVAPKVPRYSDLENRNTSSFSKDPKDVQEGILGEDTDSREQPSSVKLQNSQQTLSTLPVSQSSSLNDSFLSQINRLRKRLMKREYMSEQLFTPHKTRNSRIECQSYLSFSGNTGFKSLCNMNSDLSVDKLAMLTLHQDQTFVDKFCTSQQTDSCSTKHFSTMSSEASLVCVNDLCTCSLEAKSMISGISTPTDVDKLKSRKMEAEIFKQIEGETFNEREFYGSLQLPMFIDLTEDKCKT